VATAERPTRLRLFVAITLPPTWKEYLAARARDLERLAPGYTRWVAPELLHLTLVFLGEQAADRLPTIDSAVAAAARGRRPFRLALGDLGTFGSPPRVLWVGARADGTALPDLHTALAANLAAATIPFDEKPLVAHLTLGRARRDASTTAGRALAARLRTLAAPPAPLPFTVESIVLMQSELSPRGPRYTLRGVYPFQ
jgi:2'-5' RNA ligase